MLSPNSMRNLAKQGSLLASTIANDIAKLQEQLVQERAERVAKETALREAEAHECELGVKLHQAIERGNAREKEWELQMQKASASERERQAQRDREREIEKEREREREKEKEDEQLAAREKDEALEKMRSDLVRRSGPSCSLYAVRVLCGEFS